MRKKREMRIPGAPAEPMAKNRKDGIGSLLSPSAQKDHCIEVQRKAIEGLTAERDKYRNDAQDLGGALTVAAKERETLREKADALQAELMKVGTRADARDAERVKQLNRQAADLDSLKRDYQRLLAMFAGLRAAFVAATEESATPPPFSTSPG